MSGPGSHHAGLYAWNGGLPFCAARPSAVFIHGVLNDHSVWSDAVRCITEQGWNALAIDLPGTGRSGGSAARTVEDAADTVAALLDRLETPQRMIVGHSMGSLIAMEAARRCARRVDGLVLAGTANPMRVAPALLERSLEDPGAAIAQICQLSFGRRPPAVSPSQPGLWPAGVLRRLMERLQARGQPENLLHTGLAACDRYTAAAHCMREIACPVLFLAGCDDRMTPARSAHALARQARRARFVTLQAGHAMMAEAPGELCAALQRFAGECAGAGDRD